MLNSGFLLQEREREDFHQVLNFQLEIQITMKAHNKFM